MSKLTLSAKTGLLAALMVLVAYAGYTTQIREGLTFRSFAKATQEIVMGTKKDTIDLWEDACKSRYPKSQYCKIFSDQAPTIALIGDSHANHFFYGLAQEYSKKGDNLVNLGLPACVPLVGVNSVGYWRLDTCSSVLQPLFEKIANDPHIHTVILAAVWHNHIVGRHFYANSKQLDLKLESPLFPKETPSEVIFQKQLQETINYFNKHGKKVVLIKQIPEIDFDPVGCVVGHFRKLVSDRENCVSDARAIAAYLQEYERSFDLVAKANPQVQVWDPYPLFCDEEHCRVMRDGKSLYADDYHLSKLGSHYFSQKMPIK